MLFNSFYNKIYKISQAYFQYFQIPICFYIKTMDNCTLDCIQLMGNYTYEETCSFVQDQCQQDSIQFIQGYYCLIHQSFILLAIIATILFTLFYLALNALTQHSLTPSVQNVITRFKISPTLAGITFLAFANGAPDVLTAVLAGNSSSSSTALIPFGSIFGGSLFSTALILAAVIFQSPEQILKVKKQEVLVPLAFYIFGILFLMIISIAYGKMNAFLAAVLLIAYVIFIAYVLKSQKKRRIQHQNSLNEQKQSTSQIQGASQKGVSELNEQIQLTQEQQIEAKKDLQQLQHSNPIFRLLTKIQQFFQYFIQWVVPPRNNQSWQPKKSLTSLILSPFVLALTQGIEESFINDIFGVPVIVYLCIPAILLIIHTLICWNKGWKPIESAFYTIYSFLITIAWLTLVVAVLINLLELVQLLTNINSVFLGMTVLAWANSIGDYLSITVFAKRGRASTAISGIFSGQLFNFLIGFGCSLMMQSIYDQDGQYDFDIFAFEGSVFDVLSDSIVALIISGGLIYFVFMLYKTISTNGVFHRKQGIIFLSYYVIILLLSVGLSVLTDFFRQIICDMDL